MVNLDWPSLGIGFVLGVIASGLGAWGWGMLTRPTTRCSGHTDVTDESHRVWYIQVSNQKRWWRVKAPDADVKMVIQVEKLRGSEPRQFLGNWFEEKLPFRQLLVRNGPTERTMREGDVVYVPVAYKQLGEELALFCGTPLDPALGDDRPVDMRLDRQSYSMKITLKVTGGPRVAWFWLVNRDTQTARFDLSGPFKTRKRMLADAVRHSL